VTSKFDKKTSVHTFDCDQPGCHKNYEGKALEFRYAWRQATSEGWAYVPGYDGGVSIARHYCPEHAKQFDQPRRG